MREHYTNVNLQTVPWRLCLIRLMHQIHIFGNINNMRNHMLTLMLVSNKVILCLLIPPKFRSHHLHRLLVLNHNLRKLAQCHEVVAHSWVVAMKELLKATDTINMNKAHLDARLSVLHRSFRDEQLQNPRKIIAILKQHLKTHIQQMNLIQMQTHAA